MFDGESKERIKQLCDLIAKEQDHQRFSLLIAELNQLLEEVQPIRAQGSDSAPILPSPNEPTSSHDPNS